MNRGERVKQFFHKYRTAIMAWLVIIAVVQIGIMLGLDKRVVAIIAIIIGFISHAFAALLAWIALVPTVGPILVSILTLPFIWIINGIGYIASYFAIKQGYPREVLNYRVLTITLLVGITLGYVLGKLI
jgi:hypothetical protein